MKGISLFCGCGGLDYGKYRFSEDGFISDTYGTISFSEGFWERHEQEIADFVEKFHCDRDYGIQSLEMDNENQQLKFCGSGRWTFEATLEKNGGLSTLKPSSPAYVPDCDTNAAFLELVAREGASMIYDFKDYEPSCEVCYSAVYEVKPFAPDNNSVQRFDFEVINCESQDIGLDSRSRIENNFEEGSFVDDLLEQQDEAFIQAASEAGVTPEIFAEVLRQLPDYKGGITDVEINDGTDYSGVIRDVVDYLSDDRHARP